MPCMCTLGVGSNLIPCWQSQNSSPHLTMNFTISHKSVRDWTIEETSPGPRRGRGNFPPQRIKIGNETRPTSCTTRTLGYFHRRQSGQGREVDRFHSMARFKNQRSYMHISTPTKVVMILTFTYHQSINHLLPYFTDLKLEQCFSN